MNIQWLMLCRQAGQQRSIKNRCRSSSLVLLWVGMLMSLTSVKGAPQLIEPLGRWPGPQPEDAYGVVVVDDLAYVAAGRGGLRIWDISDPEHPRRMGSVPSLAWAQDLKVRGHLAYLASSIAGLDIVDVSDPENPQRVGQLPLAGSSWDVALKGDHAFLAAANAGFHVVDISDPEDPRLVTTVATGGSAGGTTVDGDRLYLSDGFNGMHTYDISNPEEPVRLSTLPGSWADDVWVEGNDIFVVAGNVRRVDMSDPTAPRVTQLLHGVSQALKVWVEDGWLYAAHHNGVTVYDLSAAPVPGSVNPPVLTRVAQYLTSYSVRAIAGRGNHLFLASMEDGLQVYAGRGPEPLRRVGGDSLKVAALDVGELDEDRVVVAAGAQGWALLDLSNPAEPVLVHANRTEDRVVSAAGSGSVAYLAWQFTNETDERGLGGLEGWQVDAAENPLRVWEDYRYRVIRVRCIEDRLYSTVIDSSGACQVVIYDVGDPANPVELGMLGAGTSSDAHLVTVVDHRIHHRHDNGRLLRVLDVSDPSNPEVSFVSIQQSWSMNGLAAGNNFIALTRSQNSIFVVSQVGHNPVVAELPGWAGGGYWLGDFLMLMRGFSGAEWIDFRNPAVPRAVGRSEVESRVTVAGVNHRRLYTASEEGGVAWYDADDLALRMPMVSEVERTDEADRIAVLHPFEWDWTDTMVERVQLMGTEDFQIWTEVPANSMRSGNRLWMSEFGFGDGNHQFYMPAAR